MTNTLSAKYFQEKKERLQNKLAKDIKIYLKKKKKKRAIMVMNLTKISQKMKNKSLLSRKKNDRMRKNTLLQKVMTHKVPLKVYIERDEKL